MKKTICAIIAISCAFTLWGVAGASDQNLIGNFEAFLRGSASLAGLFISSKIGGFIQ